MSRMIFVNLPVRDLLASVDFFTRLGFEFNSSSATRRPPAWCSATSACVMLLVRPFFATFTRKHVADASTTEAILAVSAESREEVDALVDKAARARAGRRRYSRDDGLHVRPQLLRPRRPRLGGHVDGPVAAGLRFFTPATSAQHGRNLAGPRWTGPTVSARRPPCCGESVRRCPTVPVRWRCWPGTAASGASTSSGCRSSRGWRASPTSWCSGRPTTGASATWRALVEERRRHRGDRRTVHRARPGRRPDPVPPRAAPPAHDPSRCRSAGPAARRGRRPPARPGPHRRAGHAGRRRRGAAVALRRTTPFTATEHARAVAFAEVAAELVSRPLRRPPVDRGAGGARRAATSPAPGVRLASFDDTARTDADARRCSADSVYRRYAAPLARIDERFARRLLLAGGGALVATVGDEVVGVASVSTCEAGRRRGVDPRRGRLAAPGPRHPAALERRPAGPRARAPSRWCCAAAPTTRR